MSVQSTSAVSGVASAIVIPPSFVRAGDSPLIEGDDWVRTVIFEGRFQDYTVTPGSEPHQWSVAAPEGMVYELRDISSLSFSDKVIYADIASSYETGDGQRHFFLMDSEGLALVHALLGPAAAADPAFLGKVSAYVHAQGLADVLQRLDADGTLAGLAGATDTDTLLAFAYTNLTGHGPSPDELAALRAEVSTALEGWPGTPATPALVLSTLLSGPSVANFFAQQQGGFSYDWFLGPLLGTPGNDLFRAQSPVNTLDLGGGVDYVDFDVPYSGNHYQVERAEDGALRVNEDQGNTWTLHNVERVGLGGGNWRAFDLEGNGAAGQAARLIGVSLGADAVNDSFLATEVLSQMDQQGSRRLVESLVDQGVFTHLAGGDSLESLIGLLYRNITGEAPSASELAWTVDWAHAQQWEATDLILFATELPQTAALIGLPELAEQGWAYSYGYITIQ